MYFTTLWHVNCINKILEILSNKERDGKKKTANIKNKILIKSKNEENFDWKRASKTSLVWLLIIFFAVYVSGTLTESNKREVEVEFSDYKTT